MNDLRVNLKVCEGCGALWLRTGISNNVYCKTCRGRLAEFPAARGHRRPLGPRKKASDVTHVPAATGLTVKAGGAR